MTSMQGDSGAGGSEPGGGGGEAAECCGDGNYLS